MCRWTYPNWTCQTAWIDAHPLFVIIYVYHELLTRVVVRSHNSFWHPHACVRGICHYHRLVLNVYNKSFFTRSIETPESVFCPFFHNLLEWFGYVGFFGWDAHRLVISSRQCCMPVSPCIVFCTPRRLITCFEHPVEYGFWAFCRSLFWACQNGDVWRAPIFRLFRKLV